MSSKKMHISQQQLESRNSANRKASTCLLTDSKTFSVTDSPSDWCSPSPSSLYLFLIPAERHKINEWKLGWRREGIAMFQMLSQNLGYKRHLVSQRKPNIFPCFPTNNVVLPFFLVTSSELISFLWMMNHRSFWHLLLHTLNIVSDATHSRQLCFY